MTLIDRIGRARSLPQPAAGRYRPLRAGILGIWEYDDQEFWFADGRLVLRGQNTAGKSKALELLLPFVLDGETRPERLDPFGNRSKTMYWNLIDFDPDHERRAALGYCWLEFGRVDDAAVQHFVTALVGLRATRAAGRRVDTWFAMTPLRVGDELELAPGGRPLTADRLREVLDGRGRVHLSARDHRAALDAELFGLGVERYDSLIHLLLQLRRPKLSEKLDVTKLTHVLTDALPPLERGRLDLLAQAFARLDADAAELEALTASHRELTSFLGDYRSYAQVQVRLRADAVRSANSQFDKVTEIERRERLERDAAEKALGQIEARRGELEGTTERLKGQLAGLDLSKVHALREVELRAEQAEEEARRAIERGREDNDIAERASAEWRAAVADAEAAQAAVETAMGNAGGAAEAARLGEQHGAHLEQLRAEPDRAEAALDASAERRLGELRALRRAAGVAREAKAKVERAEENQRDAEDRFEERRAEARAADDGVDEAGQRLAEEVDAWLTGLDPYLRDFTVGATAGYGSLGDEVLAAALAAEGAGDAARAAGDAARAAAAAQLAAVHAHIRSRRDDIAAEGARLSDRREELAEQLARVEAEVDDSPPPTAGRPTERPAGSAPLWACVDFVDELDEAERAGLEAALHAAGILDALITPEGTLLAPDALDTVVSGPPTGRGLGRWLTPAEGGPLAASAVTTALASIGFDSESGATCWVALDGRWANGPLHGRWSQPEARYIGAATRSAARAQRIADLTRRIEHIDARLAELASASLALDDLETRAHRAAETFPSTAELREAILAADRAGVEVEKAAQILSLATSAVEEARTRAATELEALASAEQRAVCRAEDVDDAIDAVGQYRLVLSRAVSAARDALKALATSASLESKAAAAESRAAASEQLAGTASRQAQGARGEAEELRRTVGADVEAVLARQRTLEGELQSATKELRDLGSKRDGARDRLAEARTRLEGTEEQRAARERERTDALEAQARLAATELATLAVGAVDRDRDLRQVTAGLTFARTVFDRLRSVDVDPNAQDASTNRLHAAFTALRSRLAADFDPHLDTSDGLSLCVARLGGQLVGATELERALAEQVERRRATLSEEERDVIEHHLLTEVGTHLGERVHAAWSLVDKMNEQLAAHPTRSGVSLRLSWEAAPEAGPAAAEALKLLRRDINLLTATERVTLSAFLADRVRAGRDDAEGADVVERLTSALDYRRWHRFVVHRRGGAGAEQFTARTQAFGSGGEQAKLAHLPLFAAMAGYYGSARPTAPRLLVLDEAFAGIDDDQRADCMSMLVELDLDPVLANFGEWGCYPEVPHIAVYHLERTPGIPGVTALRFVWDGKELREDDPFLDSSAPPPGSDGNTLLA